MIDEGLEAVQASHFFGNGISPFGIAILLVKEKSLAGITGNRNAKFFFGRIASGASIAGNTSTDARDTKVMVNVVKTVQSPDIAVVG